MKRFPLLVVFDIEVLAGITIPVSLSSKKFNFLSDQKDICIVSSTFSNVAFSACIIQTAKKNDDTYRLLVRINHRVEIIKIHESSPVSTVEFSEIEHTAEENVVIQALVRSIGNVLMQLSSIQLIPESSLENIVANEDDPEIFSDTILNSINISQASREEYLKNPDLSSRLEYLLSILKTELAIKQEEVILGNKLNARLSKSNRDAYLREQLKMIQAELGGEDDSNLDDANVYEQKLEKLKISAPQKERIISELKKFRMMTPFSSEASVTRSWLDCVLDLPWQHKSKLEKNLLKAKDVLDKDHSCLDKVKEHILEYLAVQARKEKNKGQIICFVGPPGIGKTSLAQSIAKATGRAFARISLGGVKDEAEIRGHRRTYVSAFCGRIIAAIKKAKTSNPVILLDEIDKIASDIRGDPEAALLEVLDPEQNTTFIDHYLELEYDLSDVMFIATANTLEMSKPLLDRMDVIRLSGYTEQEKFEIAKAHLVSKQLHENGLKAKELRISDEALRKIIQNYTREAGVRNLERQISKIARKTLKDIEEQKYKSVQVTPNNLENYLGIPKYSHDEIENKSLVGITTGLAWTEVGGEILSIESVMYPGKGKVILTGRLGDVMQESIQAAMSFVRSKCKDYGIKEEIFEKFDFHIHVPEGATPKDGPSAGIAMATSIMSSITCKPVKNDVAMTGEITLRGRILPIGGLKEKLLAAHRGHIKDVIIPKENEKDLKDVSDNVLKDLNVHLLENVDEVFKIALLSNTVDVV